jgi:O-acetyl-ADP-ribose deacetylase (regulator of RNase III)
MSVNKIDFIPFWVPAQTPSLKSKPNIFLKLCCYADKHLSFTNNLLSIQNVSIEPLENKKKFTVETKIHSATHPAILKIALILLTSPLILVALPFKSVYKIYLNYLLKPSPISRQNFQQNRVFAEKIIGPSKIKLVQGDLLQEKTTIIVNAANSELVNGSGVCGEIYKKAGRDVFKACQQQLKIEGKSALNVGEAILTRPGKLTTVHGIIHAVGPDCKDNEQKVKRAELLEKVYENTLKLAMQVTTNFFTISFPSLSTGSFQYPVEEAAPIAINTIHKYLQSHPERSCEVRFVFLTEDRCYQRALESVST